MATQAEWKKLFFCVTWVSLLVLHLHSPPSFSVKLRYLIFYCPLNLFYKCVAFLPVKLVLVALKEVVRTRKIAAGVHHAHHAYHHGFFIMVIVGYVKGQFLHSDLCVFTRYDRSGGVTNLEMYHILYYHIRQRKPIFSIYTQFWKITLTFNRLSVKLLPLITSSVDPVID